MFDYAPLVSIIIPAYNAANYLEQAITSALNQTYQNIEVVVVNDGSPDNGATRAVALKFGNRVRYFEKQNGGSSSALNFGIEQMRGEWFSWLSHDDLYLPNKVEREIQALRAVIDDIGDEKSISHYVICSGSENINGAGKKLRSPSQESMNARAAYVNSLTSPEMLMAEPTKHIYHGCSYLVHRDVFGTVGNFDEKLRLINDADMWYRIYAHGYQLLYVPEILVQARVHSKQISRSIGFSYHNPEQDMFWQRCFLWLMDNCPSNYKAFVLYGRNAYTKGRNENGKIAFAHAKLLCPSKGIVLMISSILLKIRARIWSLVKATIIHFVK